MILEELFDLGGGPHFWELQVPEIECPSGMTAGALGFGRSWGFGLLAWPSDWQMFRWTKALRLEAPTPHSPEAKGGSWAECRVVPCRLPGVGMALSQLAVGAVPPGSFIVFSRLRCGSCGFYPAQSVVQ